MADTRRKWILHPSFHPDFLSQELGPRFLYPEATKAPHAKAVIEIAYTITSVYVLCATPSGAELRGSDLLR